MQKMTSDVQIAYDVLNDLFDIIGAVEPLQKLHHRQASDVVADKNAIGNLQMPCDGVWDTFESSSSYYHERLEVMESLEELLCRVQDDYDLSQSNDNTSGNDVEHLTNSSTTEGSISCSTSVPTDPVINNCPVLQTSRNLARNYATYYEDIEGVLEDILISVCDSSISMHDDMQAYIIHRKDCAEENEHKAISEMQLVRQHEHNDLQNAPKGLHLGPMIAPSLLQATDETGIRDLLCELLDLACKLRPRVRRRASIDHWSFEQDLFGDLAAPMSIRMDHYRSVSVVLPYESTGVESMRWAAPPASQMKTCRTFLTSLMHEKRQETNQTNSSVCQSIRNPVNSIFASNTFRPHDDTVSEGRSERDSPSKHNPAPTIDPRSDTSFSGVMSSSATPGMNRLLARRRKVSNEVNKLRSPYQRPSAQPVPRESADLVDMCPQVPAYDSESNSAFNAEREATRTLRKPFKKHILLPQEKVGTAHMEANLTINHENEEAKENQVPERYIRTSAMARQSFQPLTISSPPVNTQRMLVAEEQESSSSTGEEDGHVNSSTNLSTTRRLRKICVLPLKRPLYETQSSSATVTRDESPIMTSTSSEEDRPSECISSISRKRIRTALRIHQASPHMLDEGDWAARDFWNDTSTETNHELQKTPIESKTQRQPRQPARTSVKLNYLPTAVHMVLGVHREDLDDPNIKTHPTFGWETAAGTKLQIAHDPALAAEWTNGVVHSDVAIAANGREGAEKPEPLARASRRAIGGRSIVAGRDSRTRALLDEQLSLQKQFHAMREEVKVAESALRCESRADGPRLLGLIDKWRGIAQEACDQVFASVSRRVEQVGGVQEWLRMQRPQPAWFGREEGDETGARKDEDRDEYALTPEEEVAMGCGGEEYFTMDLMLQTMGIPHELVKWNGSLCRWQ